jgi:hypothetical protein
VCERQLGAPAIGAEPPVRLGAREVKQLYVHGAPRQAFTGAAVWPNRIFRDVSSLTVG